MCQQRLTNVNVSMQIGRLNHRCPFLCFMSMASYFRTCKESDASMNIPWFQKSMSKTFMAFSWKHEVQMNKKLKARHQDDLEIANHPRLQHVRIIEHWLLSLFLLQQQKKLELYYFLIELRGPAYVKTAFPTNHQNQRNNDVIFDCSLSKPYMELKLMTFYK